MVAAGRAVVATAAARSIPVRLVGGVAIYLRGSPPARAALGRSYPDIDLVAHKKQSRALRGILEETGFEPERVFNATHGARRLLYHAPDGWQVDVFLDTFEMSHTLDLGRRLEAEPETLAAAELLLTKLQIAEVNRKDLSDTAMLLWDHQPGQRRPRPAQRQRGDRPVRRGLGAAHHRDRQPGRVRRPARRTGRHASRPGPDRGPDRPAQPGPRRRAQVDGLEGAGQGGPPDALV